MSRVSDREMLQSRQSPMTPLSRALNSVSLATPAIIPHKPPQLTMNERMEVHARKIRGEKVSFVGVEEGEGYFS